MKKILMMMLCLVLLIGCAQAEPVPGSPAEAYGKPAPGVALGFELLQQLYVSGENCVLSSQSLALALGMAAEGAQGDTLAEILSALGAQDVSDISSELPEGLKSANAAFTMPGLALQPEYIQRLNENYGAEWFEIDADVLEKVNSWVKEHTDSLIEQMLTEAPGAEIGMLLLNAVAMDAKWVSPFAKEATAPDIFHAPGGDEDVQMMHQSAHFDYAEKDGVQIVRLPYENGMEMWIALPKDGGMQDLLDILAREGMFYLESDAREREVILSLPKVDISTDSTLSAALKLLGVEKAFSDAADFSGISEMPLCIDDVIQKTRVQIDEEGTRAAAATMVMMRLMSARPDQEPAVMRIDRPFVFVIFDRASGSVCFSGVVENPAKN